MWLEDAGWQPSPEKLLGKMLCGAHADLAPLKHLMDDTDFLLCALVIPSVLISAACQKLLECWPGLRRLTAASSFLLGKIYTRRLSCGCWAANSSQTSACFHPGRLLLLDWASCSSLNLKHGPPVSHHKTVWPIVNRSMFGDA